jgi:hypothetical protein
MRLNVQARGRRRVLECGCAVPPRGLLSPTLSSSGREGERAWTPQDFGGQGRGAASRASSGGEGQGEEAVSPTRATVLAHAARWAPVRLLAQLVGRKRHKAVILHLAHHLQAA